MAILLPSSYYLKVILVSAGVLFFAAVTNLFAPSVSNCVVYHVPVIYDNVVFFLKPLYLYLVINCIIISIVATSKLQQKSCGGDPYSPEAELPPSVLPDISTHVGTAYVSAYNSVIENNVSVYGVWDDRAVENASRTLEKELRKESDERMKVDSGGERRTLVKSPQRSDSMEFLFSKDEVKPPVSMRFGQRKAVKASPEGSNKAAALGVSKPKKQDTLENTWKKITEGRSMPLTRHLKKADSWENSHVRENNNNQSSDAEKKRVTKSDNLNDRTTAAAKKMQSPNPSGRTRREPSLSQEELNRKVEAFIKKFNEEMRLQRQESLAQYQTMIKRDESVV